MTWRLIWIVAIAVTASQAAAKDLTPEEACDFQGESVGIQRLFDKVSYWEKQTKRYQDFLLSSFLDVRLLILENERLKSALSSEVRSAKIYARHYGDDIKEAVSEARNEIFSEIAINKEAIKSERAQQKLYQYCIDYAQSKALEGR